MTWPSTSNVLSAKEASSLAMQMKQSAVGIVVELANTFPTNDRRKSLVAEQEH